jgi:hypothetical protein
VVQQSTPRPVTSSRFSNGWWMTVLQPQTKWKGEVLPAPQGQGNKMFIITTKRQYLVFELNNKN